MTGRDLSFAGWRNPGSFYYLCTSDEIQENIYRNNECLQFQLQLLLPFQAGEAGIDSRGVPFYMRKNKAIHGLYLPARDGGAVAASTVGRDFTHSQPAGLSGEHHYKWFACKQATGGVAEIPAAAD